MTERNQYFGIALSTGIITVNRSKGESLIRLIP